MFVGLAAGGLTKENFIVMQTSLAYVAAGIFFAVLVLYTSATHTCISPVHAFLHPLLPPPPPPRVGTEPKTALVLSLSLILPSLTTVDYSNTCGTRLSGASTGVALPDIPVWILAAFL